VIAIDRPGFGYSQRPRLRTWSPTAQAQLLRSTFDKIGIGRPVVVGHSWGAMVALALALNYPQVARGLLLVSGYYYPSMRWDALMEFPPALPVIGDVMRSTISTLLGRLLVPRQVEQAFAPDPVPETFYQAVPLEMMLRPSQLRAGAAEAGLMVPAARKLCQRYRELRLPMTLVAGTEDRFVNYQAHTFRLHQELPHSRLTPLPGLGHMPHYAEPELMAHMMDDLFAAESIHPARERQWAEAS
jgi:pimeloyl-ACP methyl ester carboxylesterase